MILTGQHPTLSTKLRAPFLALAAALTLSACVDPLTGQPVAAPGAAPAAAAVTPVKPPPALPAAGENVYLAKSDGQYSVPELPVDQIPEAYRRQLVVYPSDQAPGTIIINPSQRVLYYVLGKDQAIRYGIAVGKDGFGWSGESIVANKRTWPTWTPPKEMIARKPELEKWKDGQPGGPTNPLGARAIYLTSDGVDYGYRIHGTPDWQSIGRNASSGCFRMINQDVMDLFERVQGGEKVIVLTAKGEMPTGLSIPKPPAPAPAKKKSSSKPKATAAAVTTPAASVPAPELTLMGPPPALSTPAAPATVAPAAAPATEMPAPAPAPAATPEPTAPAPATTCSVPLVNGVCPN